jgi:SAM-dependent methyltransferase
MTRNKDHWYDGWFYDKIVAPNQDRLFEEIKKLVKPQSKIIDVGCGTGRLAFTLHDKCDSVLGIDLSRRNIEMANLTLSKHPVMNISFLHGDLNEIMTKEQVHFNYATLTYVIHEVSEHERIKLLNTIAKVSDYIIIGDYLVPKVKGFGSLLNGLIEFIAGKEHYQNYKSYISAGGLKFLADRAGFKIVYEMKRYAFNNHILILATDRGSWSNSLHLPSAQLID